MRPRLSFIDLTRGIAVVLMILSHGVKGLLSFDQIPPWGMVPIHLVTKFSSTLFIMVFGIALSVAYLPHTDSPRWKAKRSRLILRGLVVLFWYKVLTIVELMHTYLREVVLDAVLYRGFPVYVEILGFYAIALLWIPFALPLWKKTPGWGRLLWPLGMATLSLVLYRHFGFWGNDELKAILVEHEGYYTWGQLSRGPLVFLGLWIGDHVLLNSGTFRSRLKIAAGFATTAAILFLIFWLRIEDTLPITLRAIAENEGKHPPEIQFMLFSGGGAFLILALCIGGGNKLASLMRPITIIGTNALQAFIFHIGVIFVIYRYLLNYWRNVHYDYALTLTVLLIALTALWIKGLTWIKERS